MCVAAVQLFQAFKSRAVAGAEQQQYDDRDGKQHAAEAEVLHHRDSHADRPAQQHSQPNTDQQHLRAWELPRPAPQQHQRAYPMLLLGTASTDEQEAAALGATADAMQKLPDQHQPAHLQHAGGMMMPPPATAAQQPASNKDLLARLLLPVQVRMGSAAGAAAAAATIPAHKQQQPTGQGRQRRLQARNNRHSSLWDVVGENTHPHAQAEAAAGTHHQQQHAGGWQEGGCGDSPGPLQQQQMLQLRAQYLLDAQSQAPGAAPAAATASMGMQRPLAAAQQQLFSPRTATHAPDGSGGSNSAGPAHSSLHQSQSPSAAVAAAGAAKKQQRNRGLPHAEQPDEIEVTPSQPTAGHASIVAAHAAAAAAHLHHQRWGDGLATAVRTGSAAATAGGVGGGGCSFMLPSAKASITPGPVLDQHAAAAGAATAGTPATAHTALIAASGSRRAAAAGLAAALFHTPRSAPAGSMHPTGALLDAPGAAGQAVLREVLECGLLGQTPPTAVQHVRASAGPTPPAQQQGVGAAATAGAASTECIAGSEPIDETQPPSQEQQAGGLLEAVADQGVKLLHSQQVPGMPASNSGSAAAGHSSVPWESPCGSGANKHKSADAAVLMPPPPPVTAPANRSPAAGRSLQSVSPAAQHHKRPGPSPLNPACKRRGVPVAGATTPGVAAKASGHCAVTFSSGAGRTTFALGKQQQRLCELHLGQPVEHIFGRSSHAVAVLQGSAGSSAHQLLLLRMAQQEQHERQRQQQQQLAAPPVAVTAEYTSVFVSPVQQAGMTRARRSPQQQAAGISLGSLRTGLLLLPQPSAAAFPGTNTKQEGPLLAVASNLQLDSGTPAAATTAGGVVSTPTDSKRYSVAALCGGSSSKRKRPRAAADAAVQGGGTSPGADSSHAVRIYKFSHSAAAAAGQVGQQHSVAGAELVQSLPVAHPTTCLAVCEQPRLLAAAGAGSVACVWPLFDHQQQQGAAGTAEAGTSPQCAAVADVSAAVVLPSACYRGVVLPDLSELCFIVQGEWLALVQDV